MAGFWCLHQDWREDGHIHFYHPEILHVHFLPDPRFTSGFLFYPCFLDEPEAVYPSIQKRSPPLQLNNCLSYPDQLFQQILKAVQVQHVGAITQCF